MTPRQRHLKRLYGITEEQYNELLERQDQRCAICLRHHSEFKTRLAVDHNHKTGEIRGALCNYCNHRIIGRHTDSSLLLRMASYLDRGTGWFVPERPPRKRKKKKVNS